MSASPHIDPIVHRFIEDAGHMSQTLGVGRVVGQIYAYLYFSPGPRCLSDLQNALGISKGGASTGVRQLEQWGAARRVWIRGDRKDYYEANDWFGRILRSVLVETVGSKLDALRRALDMAESELTDAHSGLDDGFILERVNRLRQFQGKAEKVWRSPILDRLLK